MERADIVHLARLARLRLSEAEIDAFAKELPEIVAYVGAVTKIATDDTDTDDMQPTVGPLYNVFRADVVTNAPDQYTEALLAELPQRKERFMQVPKILATDE
jgi:aspartyl-tRNA(Asn)/glutamyl-tRNA(Gln) amidotransferase subunit C